MRAYKYTGKIEGRSVPHSKWYEKDQFGRMACWVPYEDGTLEPGEIVGPLDIENKTQRPTDLVVISDFREVHLLLTQWTKTCVFPGAMNDPPWDKKSSTLFGLKQENA